MEDCKTIVDDALLCRACLSSSEALEPLSTEYEKGYSIQDMLTSFCLVRLDDMATSMYDKICKACSMETLRAYNFKLKCEQSDITLRERVQILKKETGDSSQRNDSETIYKNVDISIVKEEQLEDVKVDDFILQINVEDINSLGDAEYLAEDNADSDDDVTLNSIIERSKSKYVEKSKGKSKKKDYVSENKAQKRPGRKRKSVPDKVVNLAYNSFKDLGYNRVYECPKCSTLCKSFKLMHNHFNKLHNMIVENVEDFDRLWSDKRKKEGTDCADEKKDILDLKLSKNNGPQFKCIDCNFLCKNFENMKKHIIVHRGNKYICCDECQYRTCDIRRLARHVETMHREDRRYVCDICDYKTNSKYVMTLHNTNKHLNIRMFVCHLCAKGFNSSQGLRNHIGSRHEKKRDHICPTCGKGFFIKRHMKEHQFIHMGLKPHICEHCGVAFTQKTNLEKHVVTIHFSQERVFQCPECPYKAKSIYALKSHTRRHTDTSRFYCDICGRSFTTKDGVKRHMWRHMGAKDFKCLTCQYSCYDAGTLRKHARTHTGERPYPCTLCSYRSRTKERLKNHMKSHLNEQKFACQHCPYTANYRYNLIRHLRTNCGRTTRNYTPRKNKAAIDFSLLNMHRLTDVDNDNMLEQSIQQIGIPESVGPSA